MGRKKVVIDPICGKRLSELISDYGMTHKDFAEAIGYTKEQVSFMVNGKRNITVYSARAIAEKFPSVRFEWLMGYDDFKTEADRISAIVGKSYASEDLIDNLISLHGYIVNDVTSSQPVQKGEDGCEYHEPKLSITSPKGAVRFLSPKEFSDLIKTIDDYIEMQLLFHFREPTDGAKEYWG